MFQEGSRSTEQFQLKSYEEQDSSCYTSGTLQRQNWWTAIYTSGHKSQRVITAFMRAHLDDSVKGWFWHRRGAFVPLLSHCKLYIESLSFRCFANRALSNWLIKVNVIFLRSDGQSNYFTDGTLFLLSLSTKIKI